MKKKRVLFKLTRKDFDIQTFRSGGPGGQHQNKRATGVRIVHPASGAVGESRESRHQHQNRKLAFKRLANSDTFRRWMRVRAAEATGALADLERRVDEMMRPENLRVEGRDANGRWVPLK